MYPICWCCSLLAGYLRTIPIDKALAFAYPMGATVVSGGASTPDSDSDSFLMAAKDTCVFRYWPGTDEMDRVWIHPENDITILFALFDPISAK